MSTTEIFEVKPGATSPPPGPLMCLRCVTATCWHVRCDGNAPALTMLSGTSLCGDCACREVDQ